MINTRERGNFMNSAAIQEARTKHQPAGKWHRAVTRLNSIPVLASLEELAGMERPPHFVCFKNAALNMEPRIPCGWDVIIDTIVGFVFRDSTPGFVIRGVFWQEGEFALELRGEAVLRQVEIAEDGVRLCNTNSQYEDERLSLSALDKMLALGQLRVLGAVVMIGPSL